jgi:hypothetical protein
VHSGGTLVIPCPLNVASERVYAFLRSQIPSSRDRGLPPTLESYRLEQEKAFGPTKVFSSGGRYGARQTRSAYLRPVGLGLLAVGLVWVVAPRAPTGWAVAGVFALVLGGLLVAFDLLQGKQERRVRGHGFRGSALVVSPLGIALEQGALKGHVTWKEVRKVTTRAASNALQGRETYGPCLVLQVEGAEIPITDSYEHPLDDIHDRILQYWR